MEGYLEPVYVRCHACGQRKKLVLRYDGTSKGCIIQCKRCGLMSRLVVDLSVLFIEMARPHTTNSSTD